MASYNKKRSHPILTLIICLLLVCGIIAAAVYFMLDSKLKKLGQGASFEFAYKITSTADKTPVLYSVLEQAGATRGSVSGTYAPGKLLLAFYQLSGDAAAAELDQTSGDIVLRPENRAAEPFTRVYIDDKETLYNVSLLYSTMRQAAVAAYPIAGTLLPEWSMGDYISQTQLASLLGTELKSVELQDLTALGPFALAGLKTAEPDGAIDGYRYFEPRVQSGSKNAPTLVFGVPTGKIFDETTPMHILLTIPAHNIKAELLGTLSAANTVITAPTSRMSDEDVALFAQIRQTMEQVLELVKQIAGTVQQ